MFDNKWAHIPSGVLPFRKSTYSDGGGNCVEVAKATVTLEVRGEIVARFDMYVVRDSKDPAGPLQWYSTDEWIAFTRGVRAGEFD
jgi:hypothetical protein